MTSTEQAILARLTESYPWRPYFHYMDKVDSTNDRLKVLAKQGTPHGTVLIAGQQTGGHGRLGRTFQSP